MIFIALGTQKFQMNRLLKEIDRLLEAKKINEAVFAQIGNSSYLPKNYDYDRFLDKNTFSKKIRECDLLITHGGVSTIIMGVEHKKPVIVIPRLAEFGEHVDNHQKQIANSFSKMNFVLLCDNIDKLEEAICKSRNYTFSKYVSNRGGLISIIDDYLDSINTKSK